MGLGHALPLIGAYKRAIYVSTELLLATLRIRDSSMRGPQLKRIAQNIVDMCV